MAETSQSHHSHATRVRKERRKVRKGTQSCWECKRRKIRCTFASPREVVCEPCKLRGSSCVSQELPEQFEPSSSRASRAERRLDRLEAMMERILKSSGHYDTDGSIHEEQGHESQPQDLNDDFSNFHNNFAEDGVPTSPQSIGAVDRTNRAASRGVERENFGNDQPLFKSILPRPPALAIYDPLRSGKHVDLRCALLIAWPEERILKLISSTSVDVAGSLHGLNCTPNPYIQSHGVPLPGDALERPSSTTHPVLIARKLVVLASYLQALPPASVRQLARLGVNHSDIMYHVVETASNLVNQNDELITSLEGVECLAIESMYHHNAGDLHRAWLKMRRAMLIAQLMSLHRGVDVASIKCLEQRARTKLDDVWFRMVHCDRYFSMMLGLPQGASDDEFFATTELLNACTPVERLQRLDCIAARRILQRTEADIDDIATTLDIDRLLQQASDSMPIQWWLTPDLKSSSDDKSERFHNSSRFIYQFTHYHLLTRLHLPNLLRPSYDREHEYSKRMAVFASREVLTRFVAFCTSSPMRTYRCGIDFLVLIATMSLCLAHIDAHGQHQFFAATEPENSFISPLVHERPRDRAMMERALESIEYMSAHCNNMADSKIVLIFRELLTVEADAAAGSSYNATTFSSEERELRYESCFSAEDGLLRIHIPSFGTVQIERGSSLQPVSHTDLPADNVSFTTSVLEQCATSRGISDVGHLLNDIQNELIGQDPRSFGFSNDCHFDQSDADALPTEIESEIGVPHWDLQDVESFLL